MTRFTVDLHDENRNPVSYAPLVLSPANWSAAAIGGPDQCDIAVTGEPDAVWEALHWLGYYVWVRNEDGDPVWWGMVTEARVGAGAIEIGLTLDDMYNRVAMAYTETSADGETTRETTTWAENSASVGRYGRKEIMLSAGDTPLAQATARRDTLLATGATPVVSVAVTGGSAAGATLYCRGLWNTLGWQYYAQPLGKEAHEVTGDIEHAVGWALTSTQIGFKDSAIHDIGARLHTLPDEAKISIAGSTSNNGVRTTSGGSDASSQTTVTGTDISFDAADDVRKASGGLSVFPVGEMVQITGSSQAANNAYRWVKTDGNTAIEVTPGTIVAGAAGPSVTIRMGNSVRIEENTNTETPGANVTITALGSRVAQAFQLPVIGSWTANEFWVSLRAVGAPTDGIQVALHADSAGSPGSLLTYGATADVPAESDWVKVTPLVPPTLTDNITYWLVVSRIGASHPTNFYMLDLESEATYPRGGLKVWDGASWIARTPNAHMPFQIWGQQETSAQAGDILFAAGQFFSDVDVRFGAQVYGRMFRAGDQLAIDEVEALLESGTAGGRRLLGRVSPSSVAEVYREPDPEVLGPMLGSDGKLRQASGAPWPEGLLPAGQWIHLADVPAHVGALAGVSPFFCERADYSAESGTMNLEARNTQRVWEL